MHPSKVKIWLPILIITLGIGWLLTVLSVAPHIHWVPVLGMAMIGILVMVLGGIDKVTMFIGPFLLILSGFAIARQAGYITVDVMIPVLVIIAGVMLLMISFSRLPPPKWLHDSKEEPMTPEKKKSYKL